MKKALITIGILLVVGLIYGIYMWNKPAKSAENAEVFATTDAPTLYLEFYNNPEASAKKYLNKNIEVLGELESFAQDSSGSKCVLATGSPDMGVVSISFLESIAPIEIGKKITVRGLCAGYLEDDLLGGNLQLNQAILVQ